MPYELVRMTLAPHPPTALPEPTHGPAGSTSPSTRARPDAPSRRRPTPFFWLVSGLTVAYLLLTNGIYLRGGDSEVYTVIARNLLRGQGYTYNGNPVGLTPPGWPVLLAAGMWVTPYVGPLKLLMLGGMIGWLAITYVVLRRSAATWVCVLGVATAAVLHPVFVLSYWFHTDAWFCLLTFTAVLLGLRMSERPDDPPVLRALTAAAVVVLAGLTVTVRWQGIVVWPLIGGAIVTGRPFWRCLWPGPPRRTLGDLRWWTLVLSCLATFGTFYVLRHTHVVDPARLDHRYNTFEASGYDLLNEDPHRDPRPAIQQIPDRLFDAPRWVSVLLWDQFARTNPTDRWCWAMAAMLLIPTVVGVGSLVRKRQWVWLGMAAYVVPIVLTWPHTVSRYMVPVAPMLFVAAIVGTGRLVGHVAIWRPTLRWPRRAVWGVLVGLFATIWAYNGLMYAVEVRIMRSSDPTAHYEAGFNASMNRIGHWLRSNASPEVEIAVSRGQYNYARRHYSTNPRRNLLLTTDRPVVEVPDELSYRPGPAFHLWAQEHNVGYYVFQNRHRRLLHFRGRPWETGYPYNKMDMEWRLYRIVRGRAREIPVTQPYEPTVIPGLEEYRRASPWAAAGFVLDNARHAVWVLGRSGRRDRTGSD